jgi:hypothetical protein
MELSEWMRRSLDLKRVGLDELIDPIDFGLDS